MRHIRLPSRLSGVRHGLLFLVFATIATFASADDGYRLWLRYDEIGDESLRSAYAEAITEIVVPETPAFPPWAGGTVNAARDELVAGLHGLLGVDVPVVKQPTRAGALVLATPRDPAIAALISEADLRTASEEGYILRRVEMNGQPRTLIVANRNIGLLYGAFAFLRHLQTHQPLDRLNIVSAPKIQRRLLNHWDNLNGTVERGGAGNSLWDWFQLPDFVSPRYRDYARACASIGINGTVLTNVNANALVLTEPYLLKVAAIANVLRPYGIRVYLTARFSAPTEIGGLKTADPLDPTVQEWWRAKTDEIYRHIPDFGGFLVKANSEGQPGPQAYGRNHADGANMLADALQPRNGIVMWRAFVYDNNVPDDRHKQAYDEFKPLDGKFRNNVSVQVKNGAIDFMPREPFHPLFGAMPKTPLTLELQITQEYLGHAIHLVFLGPLFEEVLDSDTFVQGPGSTVARVVDGSLELHTLSLIAGVANIGNSRNWTGHPLAQANWYAYGRLAWDHQLASAQIADEWTRMTFSNDPAIVAPIASMLLESHEAAVNYSMPLGLHHIMAEGHHYGPGPWVSEAGRADWTSVYYHRADKNGIGFDRTKSGSNALGQYSPEIQKRWGDPAVIPDKFLLWFHHLPWDYKMKSGRTLWDEIGLHYQTGVDAVRGFEKTWSGLADKIDEQRFTHVQSLLRRQEREAREWRDACLLYFQTFSQRPLPAGVEPPEYSLDHYKSIDRRYVPGNPSGR
jgi:alpha-glucuronidase